MLRKKQQPSPPRYPDIPDHPIISRGQHRDTLDRVADIVELLQQLDLSEGLTPNARTGLYWIHHMVADTVKHISNQLGETPSNKKARRARRVSRSING